MAGVNLDTIRDKARAKIDEERRVHVGLGDDFVFKCANETQIGDARLLVRLLKGRYCFDHANSSWYQWGGHFWVEDLVNSILVEPDRVVDLYEQQAQQLSWQTTKAIKEGKESVAKETERNRVIFLKKIASLQKKDWRRHVLDFAAAGPESLGISGREWDQQPHLLACPNGVVDLRGGSFREGHPEDYLKTICPTEWRGLQEPANKWIKFLREVFEEDDELIAFVKRLFGLGVSARVVEHLFPIL
jgi:putative DNA primase/helicase